jgi:Holliday junction resolvasome RuvABC endonuclease subunit
MGRAEFSVNDGARLDLLSDFTDTWGGRAAETLAAIEAQYVGRKNMRSVLVLARIAGRLEECALRCGFRVVSVNPKTWQTATLGGGAREALKKSAVSLAKGLYGVDVSDNIADAMLIARYVAIREANK